ncbi:SseB family protein [Palleronia sediminis]|uniref:SseB family protein n=1 Tax=Palleronia sediminis TaxID=2547833 RepID=A0A4R6A0T5_9RHOB|nr:SseB family protein [Palleronia sediminis]TDL75997.1 SseB family protein [Palleronia sediminis]
MTPLDRAHAAMEAAPQDDAARLAFYERVADAELFVLLTAEPEGAEVAPQVFETSQGRFVLGFDRVERLAEFAAAGAPYVTLSGRMLAGMLAGQGTGLALNPSVAPSETLLTPEALGWLAETLSGAPDEIEAWPVELFPPGELPERFLSALDAKLATATGLARMAYLVRARYEGGAQGHLLVFVDPARGAEGALSSAMREALVFSGLEAASVDVGFTPSSAPIAARLARAGLRFDLPRFEPARDAAPAPPGSDPDRPPKLR